MKDPRGAPPPARAQASAIIITIITIINYYSLTFIITINAIDNITTILNYYCYSYY